MSLARRIIPCLDIDGDRVVKGVNFDITRKARTNSSSWI